MLSDDTAKRPRTGVDAALGPASRPDPYSRVPAPPADGFSSAEQAPSAPPGSSSPAASGSLRVRVTCARGALPVGGAHVFVSPCGGGGVCAACETDESGLSRLFELSTESAANAHIGEPPPCLRYDIEVLAEGFEPATFSAVPVYDGVTSIQCAELIPRMADGFPGGAQSEGRRAP